MIKYWRRFKNWFLVKYCGYVRLSDYVDVKITTSPVDIQCKFNPETIIGKANNVD